MTTEKQLKEIEKIKDTMKAQRSMLSNIFNFYWIETNITIEEDEEIIVKNV